MSLKRQKAGSVQRPFLEACWTRFPVKGKCFSNNNNAFFLNLVFIGVYCSYLGHHDSQISPAAITTIWPIQHYYFHSMEKKVG